MTMPVAFVSHGAPTLALDGRRGAQLRAWGESLPRPTAIVVVSAHWLEQHAMTGTERTRPLMYDFSGFPRELYRIEYSAPGSPEIAARVRRLTGASTAPERPLDHGVWVPLLHMFPAADIPVVQLALPLRGGVDTWRALGAALAPLREEGVLILGSGGAIHNLGQLAWDDSSSGVADTWALGFDHWLMLALREGRIDDVVHALDRGPHAKLAHPTADHFAPLVVTAGAAWANRAPTAVTFPVSGFEYGNLGMRSVQFS
jgi:4,5-DOPA dioxygenase extradiol